MRTRFANKALGLLLLLEGCGGGGESGTTSPPPSAPATYTVGGSATGLVGSLTLRNNGGDALTLTANGSFSFATKVAAGASYGVTVASQPSGPDCTVTGGAGTVTADVNNVTVTCHVDPATRYIPLKAVRLPSVDGVGLYVATTKIIERAPVRILDAAIEPLALISEHTVTGGASITSAWPAMLVYRTLGAAGGDHLWILDLTASSDLKPRQIGALAFRAPLDTTSTLPAFCGLRTILGQLDDPSSAFLIVRVSDDALGGCGTLIARVTDGPTTAFRAVTLEGGNLHPLYRPDGVLAGIVAVGGVNRDLVLFEDHTFATSRTLLPGPLLFQPVPQFFGPQTSAALMVTTASGIPQSLYRIDYDGTSHALYDLTDIVDDPRRLGADVYVQKQDLSTSPSITSLVRVPLDGSSPQALFVHSPDPNCNATDYPITPLHQQLVIWRTCWGGGVQATTSQVLTVPGSALNQPTTLASYSGVLYNVAVAQERILVSFSEPALTGNLAFNYSTEIRDAAGAVLLPRAPSAFLMFAGDPPDKLLQVRELGDTGLHSGKLYQLSLGSSASPILSPVTYFDGSAVVLPADAELGFAIPVAPNVLHVVVLGASGTRTYMLVDIARARAAPLDIPGVGLEVISANFF